VGFLVFFKPLSRPVPDHPFEDDDELELVELKVKRTIWESPIGGLDTLGRDGFAEIQKMRTAEIAAVRDGGSSRFQLSGVKHLGIQSRSRRELE
jgi:hypothetical protein